MIPHILLVEDDRTIRDLLKGFLSRNHRISIADDTGEAWQIIAHERIDLILLDWMLPGRSGQTDGDGFSFLKALRQAGNWTAVIMVTAKDDYEASNAALEAGADDYIRKPFDIRDVLARVKAVLRRADKQASGAIRFNGWVFDFATQKLTSPNGENIPLRASESLLLSVFTTKPQEVLDRQRLAEFVFGDKADHDKRSIDNLMVDLRKKLQDDTIIKAIRGRGYIFAAHVEPEKSRSRTTSAYQGPRSDNGT